MNIHCIILARGYLKGILNKNIIDFCGKPLLAWTIDQCFSAEKVSDEWVSSDEDINLTCWSFSSRALSS